MTIPEITPAEAHQALSGTRIIDVREPHEFEGPLGHIEGAELVPLSTVADSAAKLRGPEPLLLVCRSGKRSGMACEMLQKLGIEAVTNLAGGMIGWNRAGLPARRTEPAALSELVDQIVSWVVQVGPFTTEAALAMVCERFEREGVAYEAPTHAAVEDLLGFVAETLGDAGLPDLDLSLAAFRRSLAVL